MSRWFRNHRIAWIIEIIQIYGYINREHIEMMFGISTPQASADLKDAVKLFPNTIIYNKRAKQYEWRP